MHHRLKKVIGVTLVHFAKNCKATTCPSLLQLWIENMPLKDPEGDLFKAVCNYCRQLLDLRQSKRLVANYWLSQNLVLNLFVFLSVYSNTFLGHDCCFRHFTQFFSVSKPAGQLLFTTLFLFSIHLVLLPSSIRNIFHFFFLLPFICYLRLWYATVEPCTFYSGTGTLAIQSCFGSIRNIFPPICPYRACFDPGSTAMFFIYPSWSEEVEI